MSELDKMIERVEKATRGHDDDAITERRAINVWLHDNLMPEPKVVRPLNYCASLDAAVALCERVLPSSSWHIGRVLRGDSWYWAEVTGEGGKSGGTIYKKTPALALVLATLRALRGATP